MKILSRTQRATEVKIFVFFSETAPLQRSSTVPLKAIRTVSNFLRKARMHIIVNIEETINFRTDLILNAYFNVTVGLENV